MHRDGLDWTEESGCISLSHLGSLLVDLSPTLPEDLLCNVLSNSREHILSVEIPPAVCTMYFLPPVFCRVKSCLNFNTELCDRLDDLPTSTRMGSELCQLLLR